MTRGDRPDRETVLRLLALDGQQVALREPVLLEDVDGCPAAVGTSSFVGTLAASPEALGWTFEELGLPGDHLPPG